MPKVHGETFEEYLRKKLPDFEAVLDADAIADAKKLWDAAQKAYQRAEYCLEMQFKSKAGIDYSTDYNKNNDTAADRMSELNDLLSFYQQKSAPTEEKEHTL